MPRAPHPVSQVARIPDAIYSPFDGTGHCFLEVGNGEAVLVRGDFLDEAGPQVSMTEASAAHLEEKRQFEAERLTGWFGE